MDGKESQLMNNLKASGDTYEYRYVCSNCGRAYYVTLAKGVRARDIFNKPKTSCPVCGCR